MRRVHPGWILFYTLCGLIIAFLVLPIFIVFPTSLSPVSYLQFPPKTISLQWYRELADNPEWLASALLSIRIGLMAAAISVVFGTLTATGINRARFRGKEVITAILISPMIVPVIVLAIGIYYLFVDWHLIGNPLAIAAGHAVLGFPFVLVNVSVAYQTLDPSLEQAARSMGAGPFTAFFKVTFPLIRSGIISGALFAFITSFDELVIALFCADIHNTTLPIRLWNGIRYEMTPVIAAVSSIIFLTYIVGYLLFETVSLLRLRNSRRAARVGGGSEGLHPLQGNIDDTIS